MSFVGNAAPSNITTLGSAAVNTPLPSTLPSSRCSRPCRPPQGVQTVVRSAKNPNPRANDFAVIRVGVPKGTCTKDFGYRATVGASRHPPCRDFLFHGLVDNGTKKRHKIYLRGGTFLTCDIPLDQKCPTLKDWSNPAVCKSRPLGTF